MSTLSWGLLIATKDRPAPLKICVSLALAQTRPPAEIVIVDSSADWEAHRDEIAALLAEHPEGPPLTYLQGAAPSLTVQRNQTLAAGTADVFFMIDDDSFMHPTCAAEIMAVYEADTSGAVAGVQASSTPVNPAAVQTVGARKTGDVDLSWLPSHWPPLRWFLRRVLLRSTHDVFIPYDKTYPHPSLPEAVARLDVLPTEMFIGYRMTYRRDAARREGFDPCLYYYCPGEDLDASYRISRHGALVTAHQAYLHHYISAAGRLNRIQVAHLWSFNQAVLLRRHAADQPWARRAWHRKMLHRMVTDIFKDSLMCRFDYPQTRGSWRAWRDGRQVFDMTPDSLEQWYPAAQERIIKG